jgi:hypothetical protein
MNLLEIKQPILVDDVLPPQENLEILKLLSSRPWGIQHETSNKSDKVLAAFDNNTAHTGFAHVTMDSIDHNYPGHPEDPLFIYARLITNLILFKLNVPQPNLYRVHWNYYTQGQQGIGHTDHDSNRFISILYNPHTTDGGTEILDKFYPDKMSQAKVFKSSWIHRGITVKKDKARASLNIVLFY